MSTTEKVQNRMIRVEEDSLRTAWAAVLTRLRQLEAIPGMGEETLESYRQSAADIARALEVLPNDDPDELPPMNADEPVWPMGIQVVRAFGSDRHHLGDVREVTRETGFIGTSFWSPPSPFVTLCGTTLRDVTVMSPGGGPNCKACRRVERAREES